MTENTSQNKALEGRDAKTSCFVAGNNGGGRAKGSRNKLGEAFISDVYREWQRSGADCLKQMAASDPASFRRMVANILPAEIDAKLSVDVDLFRECQNFAQAFRLARQVLGTDGEPIPPMIELQPEAAHEHD
jgi:hypothetical protein